MEDIMKRFYINLFKMATLLALMATVFGMGCETKISSPPLVNLKICTSDTVWNVGGENISYLLELAECNGPMRLCYSINSDVDWITTDVDSGKTPSSFLITVDDNKTGLTRAGLISIITNEISDSIAQVQIIQASLETKMCVSESTWAATSGVPDTSQFITITDCNLMGVFDWTVTSDDSWATTSLAGDDTPGSFTIMVDSNMTGAERSTILTVSATGIQGSPKTIEVTQASLDAALCVSEGSLVIEHAGGTTESISISDCNGDSAFAFSISDNADWITTSLSSGISAESFTISTDANISGESRTGVITVSAPGIEGSPKTINIIQPHSEPYSGRIRIYMTEHISRYNMNNGEPYHFGFLDFSFNDTFTVDVGRKIDTTITWSHEGITQTNIFAIAAVFNDSGYQQVSNNPYTPIHYFTAYNVDACAGANYSEDWPNTAVGNFTHTVLAEKGTATWCVNCPKTAIALDQIYHDQLYPFFWVSLIEDVNTDAHYRYFTELGRFGDPTSYFDGGYEVLLGGYDTTHLDKYTSRIEVAGAREVFPLNLSIDLDWLGNETVSLHLILESPIIISE